MMLRPSWILVCLISGLSLTARQAHALEWASTVQSAQLRPFQSSTVLEFTFRNPSQKPVTITDVQTNCDCTTAEPDRRVVAPGESGVLKAHFVVGDRFGTYERGITVFTDEPGPPARLTIRLTMPDLAKLSPRTVEWNAQRQEDGEQSITIEVAPGLLIDLTEAFTTADSFAVRLATLEAGRRYQLFVRPREPGRPASTAIRIRGRERTGHDIILSAYANVN